MNVYSSWRIVARAALACLATGLLAGAVQAAGPGRDATTNFFYPSFGDLKEELDTARKEGKFGVLIMFEEPDCPWCHKMKTTVLNQPAVQDYFRAHFRPLRVDTRGDAPMTDFSGKETTGKDFAFKGYRVRATPTFIFYDLAGEPVVRHTGPTRNVEEFLWLGEFVVNGDFKRTNFAAYKQERRGAGGQPG